jgi:hypothetical protein
LGFFSSQITDILNAQKFDVNANTDLEKCDVEKSVSEKEEIQREKSPEKLSADITSSTMPKGSYYDKVAQRKKNWEYFEINHPKAISDQRLQQLKAKYQKKRSEEMEMVVSVINTVVEIEEEAEEKADLVEMNIIR